MIQIREFINSDAQEVLECHFKAVHQTAGVDYDNTVLEEWSKPVDEVRLTQFLQTLADSKRYVAVVRGQIAGFAEYVADKNELRACYVHPDFSGLGVGKKLIQYIESKARAENVDYFAMDSSVTAMPFYKKMGYEVVSEGEHTLNNGMRMKCYKMRKDLKV